jgi:catechol 2,3-dioxygenase-like lactoylglutathione lyase family enzyme
MNVITADAGSVTGLDHVGFIVPDLDATAELVEQLGFRQTGRADHTRTNSAGERVSAGSSQRSVMLHNGYIEFMQITDPAAGHQLAPATGVRHGLHVLALGTDDAAACRGARVAAGVSTGPLLHWSRPVREGPCQGEARFSYFDSRWDPQDPSYVCWVQHLTPELVRPPHLLQHDNGAMALMGVHYSGPGRLAQPWIEQLTRAGAQVCGSTSTRTSLRLGDAGIEVGVDDGLQSLRPSAIVIAFSGFSVIQDRCLRLGVQVQRAGDGSLAVDLVERFGLRLICTPASVRSAP